MLVVASASTKICLPLAQPVVSATHRLAHKTKMLISEMKKMESKDLKKQLLVNDVTAKRIVEDLGKLESAPPVPCSMLYQNEFWNAFDGKSLVEDECEYAQKHLRIFSGFYGFLRPFDLISPKAPPLVLSNKIPTPKGKNLRSWWEEPMHQQLQEDVRCMPGPPYTVVSLANEEDIEILTDAELEQIQFINVNFQGVGKDEMACKGEFLRWFIANQPYEVTDLYEFAAEEDENGESRFRLDVDASKGRNVVFEPQSRKGTWTKKLADSEHGHKKLIKQASSGKNKWKRGEIEAELDGKSQTIKIKKARQKIHSDL